MSEDYQPGQFEDGSVLPEEEFQEPLTGSVFAGLSSFFGADVEGETGVMGETRSSCASGL